MYYFIVNPSSRSGHGKEVWQTVEEILDQEDVEYRVYFTAHRYHATKLAQEITAQNTRLTLVAIGGDGTVNEILNGIRDFSTVTFAYIPTGSGNDFARALGLPSDTAEAVNNILHPSYFCRVDLGKAILGEQTQYFAVSCGCGFDAAICHESFSSPVKNILNRIHLGKLTYIVTGVKQLILHKSAPMTVTLDGHRTLRFRRVCFTAAMNCFCEGGGVRFCPTARTDDGLLDVCVAKGLNRLFLALMFLFAFAGLHRFFPGVRLYRVESIEIQSPKRLPVHMDGEPYFLRGKLRISCVPRALSVIAAPR